MTETTVFFDEAGNTGAALLDAAQPVFVLASSQFSSEESEALLSIMQSAQASEAKFTALRKSATGQRKLIEFIQAVNRSPQKIKTTVVHKRFMVLSKIVDLIEEPLAHSFGHDLYKQGANIALSNLHYNVDPLFCGQDRFDLFLSSFVDFMRNRTQETKEQFFSSVRAMRENCIHAEHKNSFIPYLIAEDMIDEILSGVTYRALDPAIPGFFQLCSIWGKQLNSNFVAVHDSSKPIAAEREMLESMMDQSIPSAEIGYDRRKFEFPLKVKRLEFGDSKVHPGLQVADLMAGATAYYCSCMAKGLDDPFGKQLHDAGILNFCIGAVWPSQDVTPAALETEDTDGINAANHMAEALLHASQKT